jgi:hypothetical protein
MPNQEYYGSPLGGHTDLLFSHPVYWTQGRGPGQALVENDPAYVRHHFSIPFDAVGRKWVRFAAWDSAGNGALVQPIKLTP